MSEEFMAYYKLGIAAFLPVAISILLYIADKRTPFGKLNAKVKQVIYGVIFGALAIVGTEWGIPLNGATANCRDAAVLCGGLMFGAPAGIIAGIIGGVERWIAVAWGIGSFTRVACSVSTIIAGFYAAFLRKVMFEDKKPGWALSLAIGIVMEVFHLTMVFVTNMATPTQAMEVVRVCSIPMVTSNGLSVMFASMALSVLGRDRKAAKSTSTRISQTIQKWMLIAVVLAFLATSFFVYELQTTLADTQADTLLSLALDDVTDELTDTADESMMTVARRLANELPDLGIEGAVKRYGEMEIDVINSEGIIVESNVPEYVGYDMSSGVQSAEFLCLLGDTTEYIQPLRSASFDKSKMRKYAGVKTDDGFIQIAYDQHQLQLEIDHLVVGITRNRHVGKTGFVLVSDMDYNIVSAPSSFKYDNIEINTRIEPSELNKTSRITINGEDYLCRYKTNEGYFIISALPVAEAYQLRNTAMLVNTFMEILVFAVLFALIYLLIKKVVVDQIQKVNSSLSKITEGDLGVVVDVRTNEEFASLSDDINSTVDTLKHYIDEASARIDKELEFAKGIQSSALPGVFPAFPKRKDFDIYASMNPAKEVGGDFYDFYMTGESRLNFIVADVSGKGIPAAMFMMRAKTELKSLTEAGHTMSEVFTDGNSALCEGNDAGMFVTAWQGSLDLENGVVTYANAGHNPPLIKRNGKFDYLRERGGFVLAGLDGARYKSREFQLEPGDEVFLYTDGVTEATNSSNELYGEDRLLEAMNGCEYSDVRELCTKVRADVDAFVGDAPQFDDITMLAFRYIGKETAPEMTFTEAKLDDIPVVTDFIDAELEKIDAPMKVQFQINVAIDEIFSNIVHYAYPEDKPGSITVRMRVEDDPKSVSLEFTDEGIPYNPLTREDPDVTLSANDRSVGGLGIFMVKKTMDDVMYRYENDHNIFTIKKNL